MVKLSFLVALQKSFTGGTCNDSSYDNKSDCEGDDKIWTPKELGWRVLDANNDMITDVDGNNEFQFTDYNWFERQVRTFCVPMNETLKLELDSIYDSSSWRMLLVFSV